jgi:zinc transport system substrate-binding protein
MMALLVPIACAPGPDRKSGEVNRVSVVAVSILPLAGIVDQLLPPHAVAIELLVPPGTTPHSFEPGIAQLTVIEGADLVVELGHPAFPWESAWLDGLLAGSGTVRVRLAEVCTFEEDDPHVWLDPDCLRSMVERMATASSELLPERRSEIESRRSAYEETIDSVDRRVSRMLADAGTHSFVVQHPAWGYYARAYGLEQHSILSHGSGDRGSVRLARVIDAAKQEGITTVIVQPQVNQDAARLVADEIGATVHEVDPLLRNPLESLEAMTAVLLMDSGD